MKKLPLWVKFAHHLVSVLNGVSSWRNAPVLEKIWFFVFVYRAGYCFFRQIVSSLYAHFGGWLAASWYALMWQRDAVSEFSQVLTNTWLCSRAMRFQSRPTNWPSLTIESPVAQWLEHPTRSRRVVGSSPIWGSDFSIKKNLLFIIYINKNAPDPCSPARCLFLLSEIYLNLWFTSQVYKSG